MKNQPKICPQGPLGWPSEALGGLLEVSWIALGGGAILAHLDSKTLQKRAGLKLGRAFWRGLGLQNLAESNKNRHKFNQFLK